MLVLKVGVPSVEYKPFTPEGECSGFEFFPDCTLPCQGVSGAGSEIYDRIVSQHFLPASMWFPSCLPDVKGLIHQFWGLPQVNLLHI